MVDWTLKYVYWLQTRFVTRDIYFMFSSFLTTRVIFIACYHLYRFCCAFHGLRHAAKRNFKKNGKITF